MDGMNNISYEQIRAGRERLGMTQQELANHVGVSLRTVGNWERGESVPRMHMAVLADVLEIEDPRETVREFGREALIKRLGYLAKRRREERGIGRVPLSKELGISDATIRDFEFGKHLPTGRVIQKLERGLDWRPGAVDEVMRQVNRKASSIKMEELDAMDSVSVSPDIASFSTQELLREVIRRLSLLEGSLGPDVPTQVMLGLAAQGHIPEHLEDDVEDEDGDEPEGER
jgi:ribosome-binding protein aMBF1 (putative translation factor)